MNCLKCGEPFDQHINVNESCVLKGQEVKVQFEKKEKQAPPVKKVKSEEMQKLVVQLQELLQKEARTKDERKKIHELSMQIAELKKKEKEEVQS